MVQSKSFFDMRAVYECGWNIFNRKGFSDNSEDISVNYNYLRHLSEVGINWLVVFWTNSEGFEDAWKDASKYAHSLGIKLAKGVYGFSGGGPEYTMAEPNVPVHLLKDTGLCPFDEEAKEWMKSNLPKRLAPDMDGVFIEPAREIGRNCTCPKCKELLPYKWDVYILNYLNDEIMKINPNTEVIPYLFMNGDKSDKLVWAEELKSLSKNIRHIFAWGMDNDSTLADWLDADPRFEHFCKLGRIILFPEGKKPTTSVEERAALVFKWCRMAADAGRKGYLFDYRIFGGREWQGHENNEPCTRVSEKLPASLALIGEAMKNPYMSDKEQKEFLDDLRLRSDWDLEDPEHFYIGK